MRKIVLLLVFYFLFVSYGCSSPFSPSQSTSEIIYVDINNTTGKEDGSSVFPFTSIVKGINYANEWATIVVRPGHYKELEIKMKRGQKLQGSGRENTIIERKGHNLLVLQNGCEVSGFFIKSEWSGTILGPAISGKNVESIRIFNNKISYPDNKSIYLEKASGHIFGNQLNSIGVDFCNDLIIENNSIAGIPIGLSIGDITYGTGISIIGSSPTIRNNHISNCNVGIYITMAVGDVISSPAIYNNTIENNKNYGIRTMPYPCNADFGGGGRNSPGNNIIRNNGKCDFINQSPSTIYAKNNTWTHSTQEEIDRYDIFDDDEGIGGPVIFVPFNK